MITTNAVRSLEKEIKQVKPFRNDYHKASVNLIFTGKWIINVHNELFHKHGLTIQQYNILRILRGQFPKATTVKLIRERMLDKMSLFFQKSFLFFQKIRRLLRNIRR